MKQKLIELSQRYGTALRKYLKPGPRSNLQPASSLGRQAVSLKLESLELARIHEQALAALQLSKGKSELTKRAEIFFDEVLTPILETHRAAHESKIDRNHSMGTPDRSTAELTATNRQLQRGIVRHKGVEAALKKSGVHNAGLLKDSLSLQKSLRELTHQVLTEQEEERRQISTELQDEVAQTLLGINVRLLSLKQQARSDKKGFKNEIASTQQLVAQWAKSVRQVARKLSHS